MVNLQMWDATDWFKKCLKNKRYKIREGRDGLIEVEDFVFGEYHGIMAVTGQRKINGTWMTW